MNAATRLTGLRLSLPPDTTPFSRADLVFFGLEHGGPSVEVRIFFNAPDADESTPLIVAAGLGTAAPGEDPGTEPEVLEAVKVALELGNDINAVDNHGETVMHGAAYKHVPSVVEYLAGAGAKIDVWNHWNADGRTPLDITIGIPSSMSIIRSAVTEATIRNVMLPEGVTPPPPSASAPKTSSRP